MDFGALAWQFKSATNFIQRAGFQVLETTQTGLSKFVDISKEGLQEGFAKLGKLFILSESYQFRLKYGAIEAWMSRRSRW